MMLIVSVMSRPRASIHDTDQFRDNSAYESARIVFIGSQGIICTLRPVTGTTGIVIRPIL